MTTNAELSELLWDAREEVAMWADSVAHRTGKRDSYVDSVRDRLDAYRAERGWSPIGFGGEDD